MQALIDAGRWDVLGCWGFGAEKFGVWGSGVRV